MIPLIILAVLFVSVTSHGTTEYIKTNASDQCQEIESQCFTFDEWIHERSHNLSSITELIFQRGTHVISNYQYSEYIDGPGLLINEIDSFILTGEIDQGGKLAVVIVCTQSYIFMFSNVLELHINNITLIDGVSIRVYTPDDYYVDMKHSIYLSTSLYFLNSGNISLKNVNISQGGVFIQEFTSLPINSTILFFNVYIAHVGIGIFLIGEGHYSFLRQIIISSSIFSRSCISFEASESYSITIHDVTMVESRCISNETKPVIHLFNLNKVTIGNLTIKKSKYPLLSAGGIYTNIEQQGTWRFHNNVGGGVIIQANFETKPGSVTEFINNTVETLENLFEISASISPAAYEVRVHYDKNSLITFKNNVVENNGLFVVKLLQVFTMNSFTYILFENNKCGTKLDSKSSFEFSEAAVMMMFNVDAFFGGNLTFVNNTAPLSGGITAVSSKITFGPGNLEVIFYGNRGGDGGGSAMYKKAQIVVETYYYRQQDHFVFSRNLATNRGGGIYVEDNDYFNLFSSNHYERFIATSSIRYSARLTFIENRAVNGGNDLYGGWIDLQEHDDDDDDEFPLEKIKLDLPVNETRSVTSDPTRICICIDTIPMCNITKHYINNTFPGKIVTIEVVAVGQRQGHVPTFVIANILGETHGKIKKEQYVQNLHNDCTSIQYTVFSSSQQEKLILSPESHVRLPLDEKRLQRYPHIYILFQQTEVVFKLSECPPGFMLEPINNSCTCEKLLINHGLQCNLETLRVSRKDQTWVSVTYDNLEHNRSHGTIIHEHCPHDYCRSDDDSPSLNLINPDVQCGYNRSGILCGGCNAGLSHVLGSSLCKKCSNYWLLALIPGVLIAGVVIIILLMVLNLTVSSGTLNGLIFYANILRASSSTYFQSSSDSFLSTFIAWLNLDLGIETCLCNGLDAYYKTWLQFFFPLYVWILVILIIVGSHYSSRISRISGNNAVQVLATMFLLSYTKLLRVIIIVFSSTVIEYPNGIQVNVWLYDGNVKFL